MSRARRLPPGRSAARPPVAGERTSSRTRSDTRLTRRRSGASRRPAFRFVPPERLVLDPGHHRAEPLPPLPDRGAGRLLAHALEALLARLVLGDPLLRELAGPDVRGDLPHRL